ncbi:MULTISPECIES: response regulator [unclassified Alcanivorax]|jgi:two-component system chemotaxis response regulator CheY|uniref:response regulator n=1 Tax=unclassified Alcanivorax TaxID=2638842 RepID=UPI00089FE1FE|nr:MULTISPECIES: response regulator [unclassified Alcanivorax]MBU84579.1 response regulator [Alcanivorax sp.]MCK5885386.1 response regulator [Alcanivorax sp.]MEE3386845.1 response regulator [Pseudomonadota bacterium]SEG14378.1 two-component system, chemotaxis family, response regulator CheY [Alcanivorax sp. DSM 26293]|tara:strand:- start:80 stop:472 length:393 start_codon:yes stop_codon:yes gene_type:complete
MANTHALVIDDSRAMRLILSDLLQQLGYEISEAGDGQEAMARLEGGDTLPTLALVDWNMPVMNGLEFIRAVRQQPCYNGMKLLVVTSEAEVSQMVEALTAGADEYLMKPFSSEALACKLEMMGLQRTERA